MDITRLVSIFGLFFFLFVAWAISEERRRVSWRIVGWGVSLQILFALVILKTTPGRVLFDLARDVMTRILDFTEFGAGFVFGSLATDPSYGAIIAFKVLPTIIFVSSLMGILFYLRVIQVVIRAIGSVMERTMRISGAEAFMAASFVFMGIESVTAVKAYIRQMTRSELFTVMTCFMSTIAGSVMAAYVSFGASAGHLLAASVMSAPAAVVISKLMVPEGAGKREVGDFDEPIDIKKSFVSEDANVIEAAANGAEQGLRLALTIGAILLAFVALIGMFDFLLGYAGTSFEGISGYILSPVAFIMGVPWEDSFEVGKLLGIKIVFNEFISYQKLQGLIASGALSERSVVITTYALCSFANFGSIAILIGGIGGVAPERKREVALFSLRALLAGAMAGFMTATIAGILL